MVVCGGFIFLRYIVRMGYEGNEKRIKFKNLFAE